MTEIGPERREQPQAEPRAGRAPAAPGEGATRRFARLLGQRAAEPRVEEAVAATKPPAEPTPVPAGQSGPTVFELEGVTVRYGAVPAVRDVTFPIEANRITAIIGPSGCGKSTLIRCLNRMNELVPSATVEGRILYHGQDLYGPRVDPVEVRKRIGMVFQKPNPFPKSIYHNVAFGPRVTGMDGNMDEIVERALRRAALWDEVCERLGENAFGLSGGQQQRLCIARALATEPDVILLDEPASALDPISTGRIEDLLVELKERYSIVIVTHNMQQAARISDMTAFLTVELDEGERHRTGRMIEYDETEKVFTNPRDPRTEAYVTGRVG